MPPLEMNFSLWIILWIILAVHGESETRKFKVIWNIPIHKCLRYNISLDLDKYDIIYNTGGSFMGDGMNIFYKFGKFPYIDEAGAYHNGGLPQLGDIYEHRKQILDDVTSNIKDPDFKGYAVLDWEMWRPKWVTNWTPFSIYREESINLEMNEFPNLTKSQRERAAVYQFEFFARYFMQIALMDARLIRPQAKWGYYGFPECYNYKYLQKYCDSHISKSNDELQWLYNISTALYPSIYISKRNSMENAVYVYGRLYESERVKRSSKSDLQILPYSIVHYINSYEFMNKNDLLITIGQVAALKFPGIVLWGRWENFNSKDKCYRFEQYFKNVLGPAIQEIQLVNAKKVEKLYFNDTLPSNLWSNEILKFYD